MILAAGLGCGFIDNVRDAASGSNANVNTAATGNKTLTDKAVDTAVGETKVGIAECDEAIDILSAQANDPDDNFVTKAIKQTALNQFREQLKKSLEDQKTDQKQIASFCRDFRDNLNKSLAEQPQR